MAMAKATASLPTGSSPQLSPEEVLIALVALLGVNYLKDDERAPLKANSPVDWSFIPWEPSNSGSGVSSCVSDQGSVDEYEEPPEIDFSSFPSLSLERSIGEQFDSAFGNRQDVEAHVSSLLSRPILVSNNPSDSCLVVDDDGSISNSSEDISEFMAATVSEVPSMMLQNFFDSFATLMNSRLRAYAAFLASHGLTRLETSTDEVDEVIVGVEQKLETMLEMGKMVATNAIVTSFQAQSEEVTRKNEAEGEEDAISQVLMPIIMDAAMDFSLPRPWGGPDEIVTVAFQTTGTIAGIFSMESGKALLRVVQVDLDMPKLLSCMIEQASCVISCIVEMTNAAFFLELPGPEKARDAAEADQLNKVQKVPLSPSPPSPRRKIGKEHHPTLVIDRDLHLVSPPHHPTSKVAPGTLMPDLDELPNQQEESDNSDASSLLSPESCESLVDYVLSDASDTKLSSPPNKKRKMMKDNAAEGTYGVPSAS